MVFASTSAWLPFASFRVSEMLVACAWKVGEPAAPLTWQPVSAMLVRAPMLVRLRPLPDLKLPATAELEQWVTWLDTASRMPRPEPLPDQAPPGEMVNVVAASAGAATNAAAATTNAGMASRPILCFIIPPQR